jgi:uncharacterized membrane protein (DUF106 family)
MALSEDKVRSLVEGDEGMADAVEAVYGAAMADGGTVAWADVNDDVSSGHWGRLIEQGVLVEDGDDFRLADEDAVARVVDGVESGEVDAAESEDDDEGWSRWDKLAGLGALLLFLGYSQQNVRAVVGGTIDTLLAPLTAVLPFHVVVLVLALVTGVITTVVQGSLIDSEKMAEYQDRMKEIQDRREEAKERGDEEALEEVKQEQMEAMGDQAGMMKEQFRPTVWIMLISIPFFLWIYWKVLDGNLARTGIVVPIFGETTWRRGVVGPMQMWIVWYFLCSMSFSNILRKALNIDISPT